MSAVRDFDFEGISELDQLALMELARKEHQQEALRAQIEQEEFARHCREANAVEGLGIVRRNIAGFAFHDWAIKENSYDCWKDKSFNKYIDRIAPETKVRCYGTKIQVGWERPCEFPLRFKKTYKEDEC